MQDRKISPTLRTAFSEGFTERLPDRLLSKKATDKKMVLIDAECHRGEGGGGNVYLHV